MIDVAGRWTTYTTVNSGVGANFVWELTIDGQGRLWIGTAGGGLNVFDVQASTTTLV